MDGISAIERNGDALKRILAALVAMAGFAFREQGNLSPALTLQRHLYRAILSLLRPAEAAARRLIVALACDAVVVLPPPRPSRAKRVPVQNVLRSLGIAVTVSPADLGRSAQAANAATAGTAQRVPSLPLLDSMRVSARPRRRHVPPEAVPRIRMTGLASELPDATKPAIARPHSADDPVDATRLGLRLQALAVALDDMPKQAKRFARWRARRDRALERGKRHRIWPFKPGRPPGGRLARFDPTAKRRANIREVDEILAHAHALAVYALERRDSS